MSKIIEKLFDGNICPHAGTYAQDSPYVQAARLKKVNYDKLMETLNDSEKERFEKYCDAEADIEGIRHLDAFSYALKFGILLMVEVFTGESEIIGEEKYCG